MIIEPGARLDRRQIVLQLLLVEDPASSRKVTAIMAGSGMSSSVASTPSQGSNSRAISLSSSSGVLATPGVRAQQVDHLVEDLAAAGDADIVGERALRR